MTSVTERMAAFNDVLKRMVTPVLMVRWTTGTSREATGEMAPYSGGSK